VDPRERSPSLEMNSEMVDKPVVADSKPAAPPATPPGVPRRGPGHRGQDVRDTVAEMAARAQEISLEAGSKMSAAMKDIIGAAAGLSDFVIESARDLVQYMVRRGQMTQDEADKLILEVEIAHKGRRKGKKGKAGGKKSSGGKKKSRPAAKKKAKRR
jgi:polyhydroxyalkanoate synthesis regulator phasin